MRCFKKVFKATTHKGVAVQPPNSYIPNKPSMTNKICCVLVEIKDKIPSDVLLWTHSLGRISVCRPAKTYTHQFCVDAGCI